MPRAITAYVSAYQRWRVWQSSFYRTETFTLTADFKGALPAGTVIESATWQSMNFANVILGQAYFYDTYTNVVCTAGLEPGGPVKCEVTLDNGGKMTQMFVVNVKTAPWFCDDSIPASGPCHVDADGTAPAMTVTKTADVSTFGGAGETITYTYVITNTGNVEITGIAATDDKLGALTLTETTLAAGASMTVTAPYVTTEQDDGNTLTNIVTVTSATTLESLTATATASVYYDAYPGQPRFVYFAAGTEEFGYFGYGAYDTTNDTFAQIATSSVSWTQTVLPRTLKAVGNTVFGAVVNDLVSALDAQTSGVFALNYDGASTLDKTHTWQLSDAQYNEYSQIESLSDGTLIVVTADTTTSDNTIYALSYTAAGGFVEEGSIALATEGNAICIHNDYVIVFTNAPVPTTLKAYSYANGTFTLVGTYVPGTALNDSYVCASDGSLITTESGQTFTFDGNSFTMTSNPSLAAVDVQFDSTSVYHRFATSTLKAYVDPSTQTGSTFTFGTNHVVCKNMAVLSGADLPADYVGNEAWLVIPTCSVPGYWTAPTGGSYLFAAGTYTRVADFTLPYNNLSAVGLVITNTQTLTPP